MIEKQMYRETIDYTWVLARQLDRIIQIRTQIHPYLFKADYEIQLNKYKAAIKTLYISLPAKIRKNIILKTNNLEELDNTLAQIIDEMEKHGLLIKTKTIMTAMESVE